jgi:hypothetical protein
MGVFFLRSFAPLFRPPSFTFFSAASNFHPFIFLRRALEALSVRFFWCFFRSLYFNREGLRLSSFRTGAFPSEGIFRAWMISAGILSPRFFYLSIPKLYPARGKARLYGGFYPRVF